MAAKGAFTGQVAVVTGGTQGLGEACARLMAVEGADGILICGRNEERGASVVAGLEAAGSPGAFLQVDLARDDAVEAVVEKIEHTFGRMDVLVNAGAATDRSSAWDTTRALWDRVMTTNVTTPFFLCQAAMQMMRDRETGGAIVNIGSLSAHGGQSELAAYSISKGALATMTKNLAYLGAPYGIRVNGINFGWMATPGEDEVQRREYGAGEDWAVEASAWQPFGRLISPEEAAQAVGFLASNESGVMTGSVVDYDQRIVGAGLLATPSRDDRGQPRP